MNINQIREGIYELNEEDMQAVGNEVKGGAIDWGSDVLAPLIVLLIAAVSSSLYRFCTAQEGADNQESQQVTNNRTSTAAVAATIANNGNADANTRATFADIEAVLNNQGISNADAFVSARQFAYDGRSM